MSGASTLVKIVSGGQTGVDRGALDAALEASFPCGGWCPAGRKAEDGAIPTIYPLTELPGAGYPERTRKNVLDSDGTLVIHFGKLSGGTKKTANLCEQYRKPALVVHGLQVSADEVSAMAALFVREHRIQVLNVAGPRGSGHPGGREFSQRVVRRLIEITK